MNKNELIGAVASRCDASKKDTERFLSAFVDVVTTTLQNGDKVSLSGFGTFEVKQRAERDGINPKTKEKIRIAASKAPAFKAAKNLKDALK